MLRSSLKEYLAEHKISQRELSNMTRLSESVISHYVNGVRVGQLHNWILISEALGCTLDDLLGRKMHHEENTNIT